MRKIVEKLKDKKMTIATMESCTGGGVANAITNIEGASEVLKFSAVTYSNEYKIKMGVSPLVIDKYSVYSMETAKEMSKNISRFAESTLGVGITGKLNRVDKENKYGEDNQVFISIYHEKTDSYQTKMIEVKKQSRMENKKLVIDVVISMLEEILS